MKIKDIKVGEEYLWDRRSQAGSSWSQTRVKVVALPFKSERRYSWGGGESCSAHSFGGPGNCSHTRIVGGCYSSGKGALVHVQAENRHQKGKWSDKVIPANQIIKTWKSHQLDTKVAEDNYNARKKAKLKKLDLLVDQCSQILTLLSELDGFSVLRGELQELSQDPGLNLKSPDYMLDEAIKTRVSLNIGMDTLGDLIAKATNEAM